MEIGRIGCGVGFFRILRLSRNRRCIVGDFSSFLLLIKKFFVTKFLLFVVFGLLVFDFESLWYRICLGFFES